MAKGLQLLLAGVLLGLMAVFSVIGVKSLLDDKKTTQLSQSQQQSQQTGLVQQSGQATTQPQVDTSLTMADQAEQKPADNSTQLTPTQTSTQNQQNSGQVAGQNQQNPSNQANQNQQNAGQVAGQNQANQNQQNAGQTTQQAANQETAAQQTTEEQQAATAEQSTAEEKQLDMQLIDEFGGLQLTLSDPATPGQPARGQFIIRDAQDQVVADMKDTDTASFDLSPGIYEITVIAKDKKSARMVKIVTGEFVTEHFELPGGQSTQQTQAGNQQQNQNQQSDASQGQNQNVQQAPANPNLGGLFVRVLAAGSRAPLKSNIYVQLPNGQHITKKNYADSATFELRPGAYKVTVKAQGKVDIVRNISIQANSAAQQVFLMESPAAQAPQKPQLPPEGTLSMMLNSPGEQNARGRFVIQDTSGKRVTRMRGVSNADIKLKPGRYNAIAVYRGARLSKPVDVFEGKTSRVVFNLNEFPRQTPAQQNQTNQQAPTQQVQVPAQQGVLQLIAVSGLTRQPLKVNFMVSTLNGQRLKTANNVSVTELSLPPQDVLVDIAYEEMRGQERIRVKAGEPTVFTFTVTPNNNQQAPINQVQQQAPQSLEEMLVERLQQEILQRLDN